MPESEPQQQRTILPPQIAREKYKDDLRRAPVSAPQHRRRPLDSASLMCAHGGAGVAPLLDSPP